MTSMQYMLAARNAQPQPTHQRAHGGGCGYSEDEGAEMLRMQEMMRQADLRYKSDERLRQAALIARRAIPSSGAAPAAYAGEQPVPAGINQTPSTTSSIAKVPESAPAESLVDYDALPKFVDKGVRYHNWFITSFGDKQLSLKDKTVKFYISKMEICPTTGREHCHMYIEFKEKKSMRWLKHHLADETINCQPRQGTAAQAIAYVKKEETTKPGCVPDIYGEPKRTGGRSDLDSMVEAITQGATAVELLMTFKGNALRHLGMIDRAQRCVHGINKIDNAIIARRLRNEQMNIDPRERAIAPLSIEADGTATLAVWHAIADIVERGQADLEEADHQDEEIAQALGEAIEDHPEEGGEEEEGDDEDA